jgi:hypothetical protein
MSNLSEVTHGSGFAHLFHFGDSNPIPPPPPPPSSRPQAQQPRWNCGFCGNHENPSNVLQCTSCGIDRNHQYLVPESQQQRWDCLVCTYSGNHWDASHCTICSHAKGSPSLESASPLPSSSVPSSFMTPPATMTASPILLPQPAPAMRQNQGAPRDEDFDRTCIICFTNPRSHLFMPCFHLVTCSTCIHDFSVQTPCPVCRTSIGDIKQVYFA